MPRQTLTKQPISRAGVIPTTTAVLAANNGQFAYEGNRRLFLHASNDTGGSLNLTPKIASTLDGQAATNRVIAIADGATKLIGPFGIEYKQTDGNVYFDCSGTLDVALVEVPDS